MLGFVTCLMVSCSQEKEELQWFIQLDSLVHTVQCCSEEWMYVCSDSHSSEQLFTLLKFSILTLSEHLFEQCHI